MIAAMMALLLAGTGQDVERPEILSSSDRFLPIDDARLLAIVRAPFEPKSDRSKWPLAIGLYRGVEVVASYRCSDLCPDYTKRIIRYNVRAGTECDRVGGISKAITVPMGIGAGQRLYCVPAVTAPYQN